MTPDDPRTLKTKIRDRLKNTVLEAPVMAVWRKLRPPVEHGHKMLIDIIRQDYQAGAWQPWTKQLIEIGATREMLPGQGSTAHLASVCNRLHIDFTTVDMDPDNVTRAKHTLARSNGRFAAVCSKGEDFLANFSGTIDYLYLDAFDFLHPHHSEERKRAYQAHLDTEITNEACWKMHLDCAMAIVPLTPPGAIVVVDDAWSSEAGWGGKGTTAIPYLLDHGFKLVAVDKNSVALRRD